MSAKLNDVTHNLKPYPMEQLAAIKRDLVRQGKPVYDFGTGDPNIEVEPFIVKAVKDAVPAISSYPPIAGTADLEDAHKTYLKNRFGFSAFEKIAMLPTRGSKEAVFHLALSVVGRQGRKTVLYPDPGYPVYKSSTLFAGGTPVAMPLSEKNHYLLEPWNLPKEVISDTAAIWINYPHNPTGKTVDIKYLEKFSKFCQDEDILILSDDCYIDIYHQKFDQDTYSDQKPPLILDVSCQNTVCLFSLSKRSGLTGYRAGFLVGDKNVVTPLKRARANMGLGQPTFVAAGAEVAWKDESHVARRRDIFTKRMDLVSSRLTEMKVDHLKPEATFYIWARVPAGFNSDESFCLELAKLGVITSPGSWLGESSKGYFRLAMVPGDEETLKAMDIMESFVRGNS